MKILLIGTSGQLGTDLRKALNKEELICPSRDDLDITRFEKTKEFINQYSPQIVVNTAAFHQVDKCEEDLGKSF